MTKYFSVLIVLFLISTCSGEPYKEFAEFQIKNSKSKIIIELSTTHPYLAEYSRKVLLQHNQNVTSSHEIMSDTGGYSALRLYQKKSNFMLIDDFNNVYSINFESNQIQSINVTKEIARSYKYLGKFDFNKNKSYVFARE